MGAFRVCKSFRKVKAESVHIILLHQIDKAPLDKILHKGVSMVYIVEDIEVMPCILEEVWIGR